MWFSWGAYCNLNTTRIFHQFSVNNNKKVCWICGNFVFIFLVIFVHFFYSIVWISMSFFLMSLNCFHVCFVLFLWSQFDRDRDDDDYDGDEDGYGLMDECEFIHFVWILSTYSLHFLFFRSWYLVHKSSISWFPLFLFLFFILFSMYVCFNMFVGRIYYLFAFEFLNFVFYFIIFVLLH